MEVTFIFCFVRLAFVPLYNPAYLNASDRTKRKVASVLICAGDRGPLS